MTNPKVAAIGAEPRPTSTNVDVFGLTERGRVRTENQDQFLIASLHKLLRVHQSSLPPEDITTLVSESRGYILLVADGVGGRPDGQAASGTVVKTIANHVTHFTDLYRRLDSNNEANFVAELEKSVLKSHDALIEEGKKEFGGRDATPSIHATDCRWDDVILLCTDGLTRHVTDAEIEAELRAPHVSQESCQRLVQLALDRGGEDNVTVVIGRLRNKPQGV